MVHNTFIEYLDAKYPANSGSKKSYLVALSIIDRLFALNDKFNLNHLPVMEIRDPFLIEQIVDFVADEEDKYRAGQASFFDDGSPKQSSYPRSRFCTAAIRRLRDFINHKCICETTQFLAKSRHNGKRISTDLLNRFKINHAATEKERLIKQRIGQQLFREMLLSIYDTKCCLTGLDIPEVLRASHIVPWAECEDTRLNPENGLCLSATYDAAFDKHLITFDEDYRMVLSPMLKDVYTSEAFHNHFLKLEGKKITLPVKFMPSQKFMESHRAKLII